MDLEAQTPQNRLTIVLFTYDFPPFIGGISAYTLNLARGIGEQGHDVHVVCPGTPWDAGVPGVRVHRFDAGGSDFRRYRNGRGALERVLRTLQPDLLHAVSSIAHLALGRLENSEVPPPSLSALRSASQSQSRSGDDEWKNHRVSASRVMTVHGTEILRSLTPKGLGRLRDGLFRPAYMRADGIICVSQFTRSLAESHGLPADRLTVVHNGVDTSPRYHPPEADSEVRARYELFGRKILLTVAHLHPRKGQAEVLRALPDILRSVPEAVYVMVGAGDALDDLRLDAHERGLDGAVRFCGEAADSSSFYGIADVLIQYSLPAGSSIEGFGLSVAEAMAEGVPVVVSDTGGLPEVVEDGNSGLVVPHDEPERLPQAILRILKDPAEARRLGEAGRERAQRMFSLARFAGDTLAVYKAVLRGRG